MVGEDGIWWLCIVWQCVMNHITEEKVHSMLFWRVPHLIVLNLRLRSRHFIPIQPIILQLWKGSDVASHKGHGYYYYYLDEIVVQVTYPCRLRVVCHENEPSILLLESIYTWVALAPKATPSQKKTANHHLQRRSIGRIMICFRHWEFWVNLLRMCQTCKNIWDTQGNAIRCQNPFE